MKKYLLPLIVSILLVGCSSKTYIDSDLVGTWYTTQYKDEPFVLTLEDDGTGTYFEGEYIEWEFAEPDDFKKIRWEVTPDDNMLELSIPGKMGTNYWYQFDGGELTFAQSDLPIVYWRLSRN